MFPPKIAGLGLCAKRFQLKQLQTNVSAAYAGMKSFEKRDAQGFKCMLDSAKDAIWRRELELRTTKS